MTHAPIPWKLFGRFCFVLALVLILLNLWARGQNSILWTEGDKICRSSTAWDANQLREGAIVNIVTDPSVTCTNHPESKEIRCSINMNDPTLLAELAEFERTRYTRIHRSPAVRRRFQRLHPCPSTGKRRGRCDGWVVDHRVALCKGGPDIVENMQWMRVKDAKAKDRWECK